MAEAVITAENIGHFHVADRWLFRGLSISLSPGRVLAILGPNGRGKSTLLRVLAGLIPPREGRVRRRGRIAFVPAVLSTAFDYTALDIVLMGRAPTVGLFAQPTAIDEAAAFAALGRLGISSLAHRAFSTLSTGERQMVLLARSLVGEAGILMMDEPTAALDLAHKDRIASSLRGIVCDDRIALLFTTHDPDLAVQLATDVLLMREAGHAMIGDVDAMLTSVRLSALFGCDVARVEFEYRGCKRVTFAHGLMSEI